MKGPTEADSERSSPAKAAIVEPRSRVVAAVAANVLGLNNFLSLFIFLLSLYFDFLGRIIPGLHLERAFLVFQTSAVRSKAHSMAVLSGFESG